MESTSTDKAVVLARGLGTRMQRADASASLSRQQAAVAETGVKALIPMEAWRPGVIERPFLDYVLSALARAGFTRVCLVTGPQQDALRDYYRKLKTEHLSIEFALQLQPKGTADAVAAAEAFADGRPFVVINSDNYYPVEALEALRRLDGCGVALFDQQSMIADGNVPEERVRQFAVGRIDGHGCLKQVIEKPDAETLAALGRPLWVSMNCWRFDPLIFDSCRAIGPSARGEHEITDAVQHAISESGSPRLDVRGVSFRALTFRAPVLDLSSRRDVAPVTEKLAGMEVTL